MIEIKIDDVSFYTTKRALRERRVGTSKQMNDTLYALYQNMFNAIGVHTTVTMYDERMQSRTRDISIRIWPKDVFPLHKKANKFASKV